VETTIQQRYAAAMPARIQTAVQQKSEKAIPSSTCHGVSFPLWDDVRRGVSAARTQASTQLVNCRNLIVSRWF
jgi:hypothetical protein